MKYIFIVGAPGSKWSSVAKNIYHSADIDSSDSSLIRTYNNSDHVNHAGAYFDPGMEFGNNFDCIDQYSRTYNEIEFNKPFTGTGIRIIKSHCLSNHIDYLKQSWADCPIILVYRDNDVCLGWWVRAGGFDITYPDYKPYYQNYQKMAQYIDQQNLGITNAWNKYNGIEVANNHELTTLLGIDKVDTYQDYIEADIKVKIIL